MKEKMTNSPKKEMKNIENTMLNAVIIVAGITLLIKLSKVMISDLKVMGL